MSDRLSDAIRAIVRAELPELTFLGTYEYTVQRVRGARIDATPASDLPLPPLVDRELSPSTLAEVVSGAVVGSLARVQFVNGDPTRPEIVGLSAPSSTAAIDATDTIALGAHAEAVELAGGAAAVGRIGDMITVFLPLTPVAVSGVINGALNFGGFLSFPGSATGIVVGGNPRVRA